MFEALECLPLQEHRSRIAACLNDLARLAPQCSGMLVFSRMNIYYLTGTWAGGALWVPQKGRPLLLCRKGMERAVLESPMQDIIPFRSASEIPSLARDHGVGLGKAIGVEMAGLPWGMGRKLERALEETELVPADHVLARIRSVKSEWELSKMRLVGARHHECLTEILPERIHPGMTEREIAIKVWEVFFSRGHQGMLRMQAPGEEAFLGHVSAGDSGIYPSVFNGPLGLRGQHPAMAQMGSAGKVWQENEVLMLDCGFCVEGYHTDKTQAYWSSSAEVPAVARDAQNLCLEIQAGLADSLRPGVLPSELYAAGVQMAEKAGFSAGFMGLGSNQVRFIGHGIGLAVDETPVIAARYDEPFEVGMVMALEPKIGIPGIGMVGTENTFEVTESGGRSLTGGNFEPVFV
ncbi:MAG TPA: Xaa-Pro peptidase family protein [Desulfomicrobiaceae bacterium]|nr:Xaa-Pro peptidase family protein [Desulfomicrobiaceae bacterium]